MKNYSDKTDEELLKEYYLERNPSFINEIFTRYADVGFRTAMRYVHNASDAEDVLQVAFIQFLQNVYSFREGTSTVKPWLMKMIVNASKIKLREEGRRSRRQRNVASERFLQHQKKDLSPDKLTEKEELKVKIRTFVDTLPEKYRSPIWLVLYEGFTYPEVASVLALPEKTVRTQVSRGVEKLKEILGSIGSVLSIDIILSLIAESKLEAAPISVKQLIDSPELYKAVPSKMVLKSSLSFLSLKSFIGIFVLTISLFTGLYFFKNIGSNQSAIASNQAEPLLSEENKLIPKDTNQTWDFINEKDRDLPLLRGEWEWSKNLKGMSPPVNGFALISLPINIQKKCFLIEHHVISLATIKNPELTLNLTSYWANENLVLGMESFTQEKYHLSGYKSNVIKSYFYQNYIYSFANNIFVGARKYSEDLTGANVVFLCRNYAIKKIVSKTLDTPPDELIKAFKLISTQVGQTQSKWLIKEAKIIFNN